MIKISFLFLTFLFVSLSTHAQTLSTWNGKGSAVVLTYDDGLNIDLSNVVPALDSVGLKGTFYISDHFNGLNAQLLHWRTAAAKGHELANHSLFHPCEGGRTGREFVKPDRDMNNYTVKRMQDEIRAMNTILKAIDGKSTRTFAYPCGDTKIHDTSYIDGLQKEFIAARGVRPEMLSIDKVDLYNIGCYSINGQSGAELIALVKKAMETHTLLVFLFHGVGGEHSLNVSLPAHRELLHFLQQNKKSIWIAPMIEVSGFIRKVQASSR